MQVETVGGYAAFLDILAPPYNVDMEDATQEEVQYKDLSADIPCILSAVQSRKCNGARIITCRSQCFRSRFENSDPDEQN